MKNDYLIGDMKISVPPTVLFSILGKISDVQQAITMDAKAAGDLIYVLGETFDETGGSEYFAMHGHIGARVPKVNASKALNLYQCLCRAIEQGLVRSCHDCSDGGLGIALAESACAGGLGMVIDLKNVPAAKITRNDVLLFSETQSRFVVSVSPDKKEAFERCMHGTVCGEIGVVTREPQFRIIGLNDTIAVDADIYVLKECWQKPLRF